MPALQRAASSTACGAPLPAARHAAFLPFRAANARTVSTKAADKQSAVAAAPKTSKAKANGATATPKVQNAAPAHTATSSTVFHYFQLEIDTAPCKGVGLFDITPEIRAELAKTGITEGVVNVVSRHTTTAVIINESEPRLLDDIRQWLHRVASPSHPYLHNDMHLREAPKDWPGGWAAWSAQEPINAHAHLQSIALGNTLAVPVTKGALALGTWQSVLLVELDGPRKRTVGVQILGQRAA